MDINIDCNIHFIDFRKTYRLHPESGFSDSSF